MRSWPREVLSSLCGAIGVIDTELSIRNLWGGLACDLQAQFIGKLRWFEKTQSEHSDSRFWLGGGQWLIPPTFHGSARTYPATLSFYAQGPDFLPLKKELFVEGGAKWNPFTELVDVMLCTPKKLHVWHVGFDAWSEVETVGHEYDLVKQRVSGGPGATPTVQLLGYGRAGTATTWVRCDEGGGECRHAFAREGMVVSFMHSNTELVNWRLVQDALWSRVKSFSLVWPDVPVLACDSQ